MTAKPEITVCYNGACPVCRAGMTHYAVIAEKHALPMGWDDINTAPELFRQYGIRFDQALRRLYAVNEQGQLLRGVDVFIAIWRRLPGYRWLGAVAGFPLIRPFAWFVYEYLVSFPVSRWSRRRLERVRRGHTAR